MIACFHLSFFLSFPLSFFCFPHFLFFCPSCVVAAVGVDVLLVPPPSITNVVLGSGTSTGIGTGSSSIIATISGSNLGSTASDVSGITYSAPSLGIFNSQCSNIQYISSSQLQCTTGADVNSANVNSAVSNINFVVAIRNVQSAPSPQGTATLAQLRN